MKKTMAIILVLVVIISVIPCTAYAADKKEHIDVSQLKDEELLAYYFEMQEELMIRGLDASKQIKLSKGNYTVDYDVPAAYYNLICIRAMDDDTAGMIDAVDGVYSAFGLGKLGDMFQNLGDAMDVIGSVTVDILSSSGEVVKSFEMSRGKIEKITLEANQIIQVSDGIIALNPIE